MTWVQRAFRAGSAAGSSQGGRCARRRAWRHVGRIDPWLYQHDASIGGQGIEKHRESRALIVGKRNTDAPPNSFSLRNAVFDSVRDEYGIVCHSQGRISVFEKSNPL